MEIIMRKAKLKKIVPLLIFAFAMIVLFACSDQDKNIGNFRKAVDSDDGLCLKDLKLSSHTIYGRWLEKDFVIDDIAEWSGSAGVIKKENGKLYLISNSHCLALRELQQSDGSHSIPEVKEYKIEVKFASGKDKPVLRFAVQEGFLDLLLLEVDATGLEEKVDYVILPHSEGITLSEGDDVVAVGSPIFLPSTHTFGKISAFRIKDSGEKCRIIQTDAAINFGNSGGPLFLKKTKQSYIWIGINTWKIPGADNIGFAIDARDAIKTKYRWFKADSQGAIKALKELYNG